MPLQPTTMERLRTCSGCRIVTIRLTAAGRKMGVYAPRHSEQKMLDALHVLSVRTMKGIVKSLKTITCMLDFENIEIE